LPQLKHICVCALTAAVLTVAVTFSCQASEQTRRFPVELEILAANANDLLSPTMSSHYKRGLQVRMAGSLGTLRFLAREYRQATHTTDNSVLQRIDELRRHFRHRDWRTFARVSRQLAQDYPLTLRGVRPADAGPADIMAGRHIYQHLCMGCHEHPDTTSAVPAPNLYHMVRSQPQRESIARFIAGVHGTPAVALRNPFSDREIAGMLAYLGQSMHPRPSQGQ